MAGKTPDMLLQWTPSAMEAKEIMAHVAQLYGLVSDCCKEEATGRMSTIHDLLVRNIVGVRPEKVVTGQAPIPVSCMVKQEFLSLCTEYSNMGDRLKAVGRLLNALYWTPPEEGSSSDGCCKDPTTEEG